MAKALTAAACRKYRPRSERYEIKDGAMRGLSLMVYPSGQKSFQVRMRVSGGRTPKQIIGSFDPSSRGPAEAPTIGQALTLADAHVLAAQMLRERALGNDPIADHKRRKHAKRLAIKEGQQNAFPNLARDYVKEYARLQLRRWRDVARLLGLQYSDDAAEPELLVGSLCDRWRDRPADSITDSDIWSAVSEAHARAVPGIEARNEGMSGPRAAALRAALSRLFAWAQRTRRVAVNPVATVHAPAPPPKARDRVLSEAELRWLWAATDPIHEPIFGAPVRLAALTGQRMGECCGLRYSEISEDGSVWVLPGARVKNKRVHTVPLSKVAQALIAGVPRLLNGDLAFSTNGITVISGWSKATRRIAARMASIARKERPGAVIPAFRLHDIRRSVATHMAETGIAPPHIIEAVLNHISGHKSGVGGVYNRAVYQKEKESALDAWSRHLLAIVSGEPQRDKVVNLSRRRSR